MSAAPPPAPPLPHGPRRGRGAPAASWVFLLVLGGGLGLLALLRFAADDVPSIAATDPLVLPTPQVDDDQACTDFARYLMADSGLDIDAQLVSDLTNCYPHADGTWYVPLGRGDVRLPESVWLTEEERDTTAALRRELLAQIDELEDQMPASLVRDLERIYEPRPRALYGNLREGAQIARTRSRYTRLAEAFLIEPERHALADYVAWYMARRLDAYRALVAACERDPSVAYLINACRGLDEPLAIRHPPWTWDLRNSLTLEHYLGEVARSGTVPAAGRPNVLESGYGDDGRRRSVAEQEPHGEDSAWLNRRFGAS